MRVGKEVFTLRPLPLLPFWIRVKEILIQVEAAGSKAVGTPKGSA